ncbi:hypothetical protein J7L60_01905 [Candidatus Bathyarchaeota archaeon]|nr:hypothetical protein [Candidatus Bathyarchaeota archaeon]
MTVRPSYVSPGLVGPVSMGLDINALIETILMFFLVFMLFRGLGKVIEKK